MSYSKYFSAEGFCLYWGNCIEILEELEPNSIDMIFADPPYFLSDGTITCKSGKMVSVKKGDWDLLDEFNNKSEFHHKWISACRQILKPSGTIWISGTYHSIYQCGYELQKQGFRIINDICWFKPNAAPNLTRKCFTASHETILWAIKDPLQKQKYHYELMKNTDWIGDIINKKGKQMRSVWCIPTTPAREKIHGKHPTQKPIALLERIILSSTDEGDLVLDPFNGSGTTGVVAKKYHRNYIGIDINIDYLKLTIERIKDTL